jgi:hypothetical protein
MLSSGLFPGVCSFSYQLAYEAGTDSVPKRWHLNYRHREITQKKAYDIHNHGEMKSGGKEYSINPANGMQINTNMTMRSQALAEQKTKD